MTVIMSNQSVQDVPAEQGQQASEAVKFEYVKFKFVSLRENLKFLLEFLNQMENHQEEKIDNYQVMKIKTNFFIDEIDYHLRGDVTDEHKEYFTAYANFYTRSRTELIEVLNQVIPNRQFFW